MASITHTITNRYRHDRLLPASWYPTGWTGPTGAAATVAYLNDGADRDRLARHLDLHHPNDPATRDLLVAASLHHPARRATTRYLDELTTELYLVYAELHTQPRDKIVHRALIRARKRVHDPKRRRPDLPKVFVDDNPEHRPGHLTLTATTPTVAAARVHHPEDIALANIALHRFRTEVLRTRPGAWPAYHALIVEELTGQRLPTRPDSGHLARARQRAHDLAVTQLR